MISPLTRGNLRVIGFRVGWLGQSPRVRGNLNLLADRCEHRFTIVIINIAFSEWVQVFGDQRLTTALFDRLGCYAHILTYPTRGRGVDLA